VPVTNDQREAIEAGEARVHELERFALGANLAPAGEAEAHKLDDPSGAQYP